MKKNSISKISAGAILLTAIPFQLQAASIYTSGHGDIGVGYDASAKEFEPHWHMDATSIVDGSPLGMEDEFEAGDLIARVAATRLSPNGLSTAIGVADGTEIYAVGSSTYQPNLGFAVEELDVGDWVGNITLTLTGWTLPSGAEFSLYTTNLSGTNVADIVFSRFNPSSTFASNGFEMTPGDHVHFQFGFTKPGTYDLELTWTGTHAFDGAISTTESFSFHVIPEPSSFVLCGLALGLAGFHRRR